MSPRGSSSALESDDKQAVLPRRDGKCTRYFGSGERRGLNTENCIQFSKWSVTTPRSLSAFSKSRVIALEAISYDTAYGKETQPRLKSPSLYRGRYVIV